MAAEFEPSAFIYRIRCDKWIPGVAERDPRVPIVGVCPGTDDNAFIAFLFPWADDAPDPGICILFDATCCYLFYEVTLDRLKL